MCLASIKLIRNPQNMYNLSFLFVYDKCNSFIVKKLKTTSWEMDSAVKSRKILIFRFTSADDSFRQNSDSLNYIQKLNSSITLNIWIITASDDGWTAKLLAVLTIWTIMNKQYSHKELKTKNKGKYLFSNITASISI